MDADNFLPARLFYELEFKEVLKYIYLCSTLLIDKYEGKKIDNNENKIRNILYKDFLNSSHLRRKAGLFPCRFECESAEIDENYIESGYTDIKVVTEASLHDSSAYYIIECKRLDGNSSLNNKYISEGILRFVQQRYPSHYKINGMIGFVVKSIDINKYIENVMN